jgi:hypothetical protein
MPYYDADWVPERIPDSAVRIPSMLYMLRLMKTEQVTDPATGEKRLKKTELIRRVKARGQTDADLLHGAELPIVNILQDDGDTEPLMRQISELKDYKTGPRRNPYRVSGQKKREELRGCVLLDMLRADIFADVCGRHPLSSLNYVWITCHIMMLFMSFEDRFREARHPLWVEAYEHPQPALRRQRRLAFVMAAIADEDDGAMRLFAETFERFRLGALACIYWKDLREEEYGLKPSRGDDDGAPMDQCSVM